MRVQWLRSFVAAVLMFSCFLGVAAYGQENEAFRADFSGPDPSRWQVSSGWTNGTHQGCEWRVEEVDYSGGNVQLGLSNKGGTQRPYGCSEIHTGKRYGYGLYETRLKTASGSGLNTGFFTYVGPPNGVAEWDEIDFEFLGKDPTTVNLNHFTNGKAEDGKVIQLGFDASKDFHNYAIDWTPTKISWYVDYKLVLETPGNAHIPRNPGSLFLTLWSGSDEENAWMGPFKYTAPVKAEASWAAFTPPGGACQFPESLRCKK
jgi:endo-1,3-1,4-beta-glycanase ExoK